MDNNMHKINMTFEEIVKQNERRIYYQIHKLNIRDPHQEFYQEGLVAMWNAYETYRADKGPMATYFNYTIRNRLIDLIRSKAREQEKLNVYREYQQLNETSGNFYRAGSLKKRVQSQEPMLVDFEDLIKEAQQLLSTNQLKWLYCFLIQDMSIKSISKREGVSIDAVKSWGREARKKLRAAKFLNEENRC